MSTRTDDFGTTIRDFSDDGSHPTGGNFRKSSGATAYYGGATYRREPGCAEHPKTGSFVLTDRGEAYYGGAHYQRVDPPYPEPEPRIISIADTLPYKQGDRVVYTIPEKFGSKPGAGAAQRDAGHRGTVVEQTSANVVRVRWDNENFTAYTASEFVALAPEPTHKHPEGLYRDKHSHSYFVFVRHENTPGDYAIVYVMDVREDDSPVNRYMSDDVLDSYELVTATS